MCEWLEAVAAKGDAPKAASVDNGIRVSFRPPTKLVFPHQKLPCHLMIRIECFLAPDSQGQTKRPSSRASIPQPSRK